MIKLFLSVDQIDEVVHLVGSKLLCLYHIRDRVESKEVFERTCSLVSFYEILLNFLRDQLLNESIKPV